MDLNELLKSAPQLQSIATTIVAGVPLTEIIKRIVVPSADLLGERMKDRVERCLGKSAKMIEDAGINPQPVEDKLVVEILRNASLEENEDLHTMWAGLLANAASKENPGKVRPAFVATLKEMSPDEAVLLERISISLVKDLKTFQGQINEATLSICLDSLEAWALIRRSQPSSTEETLGGTYAGKSTLYGGLSSASVATEPSYFITDRGQAFLEACRPPSLKK